MQPLSVAKKLFPGILFLLLAVFSPLPRCLAVTIVEIYDDDAGEGFLDQTALTQDEKASLAELGNDADTVGEARKNAFEHATSILENRLANTNTIRVSAKFTIFPGQEDPNDPDKCGELPRGTFTVAVAGPRGQAYPGDRLVEGDASNPGRGTGYPPALFEALSGENFNGQDTDIFISFSKCIPFYYGLTEPVPAKQIDFVQLSLHETIHGLGFSGQINEGGSFSLRTIEVTQISNGEVVDRRQATIRSRTIYDEQLYSETDDDLLIDLTNSERAEAITSGTGLLWEGTDGGRNSCSYGKRMAELKPSSAKSQDGKPRLHAPSTYESGGSVIHTHANTEDIMEAFVPAPKNMDLTLGMLKDMGWSVRADGFPPDCEPTGIDDEDPVQPPPPAVTVSFGLSSYSVTEGEAVVVRVMLSADPERTVTIPITIDEATTAATEDYSLQSTSVTFASGETSKNITLTAADDDVDDDSEVVVLAFGTLPQRVFRGARPSTTVTIADPEPPPAVTVSFGLSSYSVTEGEAVVVRVMLSADPERTVTIPITIDEATTAATEDYSLQSTSVTFASGETSKNITLTAADDDVDDDSEVVVLAFGTLPQRVSRGARPSTTVTIADPEPPVDTAAGSGGGCSVGAAANHGTKSAAAHLLAAIAVLLPVFFRKSHLTG